MHLFLYTIVNQNYAWNLEKSRKSTDVRFYVRFPNTTTDLSTSTLSTDD